MTTTNAASPLSEERVREYEQMLAAVTPGPWTAGDGTEATFWTGPEAIVAHREDGLRRVLLQFNPNYPCAANARFIAASPTIVAALLSDRAALTARLEAVERLLGEAQSFISSTCEHDNDCFVTREAGCLCGIHDICGRITEALPESR